MKRDLWITFSVYCRICSAVLAFPPKYLFYHRVVASSRNASCHGTYFQSRSVPSGGGGVHLSDARNAAHASDYVHLLRAAFDFDLQISDFPAAILAFVANYAAYFAEIFRGGIQSISRGQYEGAKVLGFTYKQTMWHIILPQVVKRVIPPLGNETITLLKDTSLVYILAMNDLMRVTRAFVQRDFDTTPFLVAGVFYLVCTAVLTKILTYVENRYAVYEE